MDACVKIDMISNVCVCLFGKQLKSIHYNTSFVIFNTFMSKEMFGRTSLKKAWRIIVPVPFSRKRQIENIEVEYWLKKSTTYI
jgi:hypothetical protein